jgi:phospholipase C
MSNVKHVVLLIQENHTFDDHFGAYCTAAPGSSPTCNSGPACCEAAPPSDPAGHMPVVLDDATQAGHDPDNTAACELAEMDNGKNDMYTTAPNCGDPGNVATSDPTIVKPYWDLAAQGALADHYFQPVPGASSANMQFFARARWVFDDNAIGAQGAVGITCDVHGPLMQYTDQTIGDLLTTAGVTWSTFAGGYTDMASAVAMSTCPAKPMDCAFALSLYPCVFDPGDVPFEYYASTSDKPAVMKDVTAFYDALANGGLPAVSFIRAPGYKSEHPGHGDKPSAGVAFATDAITRVETSRYRGDTLLVLVYDEGGGYYDHIAPPAPSAVDGKPYGTRVPMLVIGPFAKKSYVSHVVMEHSSIVKFLEWNFLGGTTGQLAARDATVANIGDLLDPSATGTAVPQ